MDTINLIPKKRRLDRQKRLRIQRWIGVVSRYAVAALVVCMMYTTMTTPRNLTSLSDELAGFETELTSVQQQRDALQPRLNEKHLILTAGRSITDQPDWSLLLTYLADELLGDQVVLNGCSLAPDGGAVEANQINHTPMALTLAGYARTTPDVSQFVLRLEQMSLFEKVTLVKTNREPFLDGQAIAFQVRCSLQPTEGGIHE